MTAKEWRESNPSLDGNIRDVNQLVCLANMESLNAHFIEENLSQVERLNKLAITQMRILNTKQLEKCSTIIILLTSCHIF